MVGWLGESKVQFVCNELAKLSPLDLTVFENQIRNPKYKNLIESCYITLVKKLDDYWRNEKESLPLSDLNFKLKTATVNLDQLLAGKIIGQLTEERQMILTFDDGPHPEYTEKLLRLLDRVGAKATFFMLGQSIKVLSGIVRKAAKYGAKLWDFKT